MGNSTHDVRADGLTGTGTSDLVVLGGRWLERRLSVGRGSRAESKDRSILLAGEAQRIRGCRLELN